MHDQHTTPQDAPAESPAAEQSQLGHDMMKVLADVEGQLTRLRSAQKQQDDAIAMLTTRSKALRAAEDDIARTRSGLDQQTQQLERDRGQLQKDREQFAEQCRHIDQELRRRAEQVEEMRRGFEQQRSEIASEREQARQGLAELEKSKASWETTQKQAQEHSQRALAECEHKQAECRKAADDLAMARSQWERQRQESQAQLDARGAELERASADLTRREADLARERARIESVEHEARQQQQAARQRHEALEKERAELLARINQAERNVGELIQHVEKAQHELAEERRKTKVALEAVTAAQERERKLENATEAAAREIKRIEATAAESQREGAAERHALQTQVEAVRKESAATHEALDSAMTELEATRKKVATLQRDLQARDQSIAAKDEVLGDQKQKLEMAGRKLSEFAQILSEQTPQLERGAAALAMVEEQAEQIDRLTKQLAELQLANDVSEIQRRDKRIEDLTEALRQARGQNGGEAGIAEIEQHNAQLEREVRDLRLELQNAQIAGEEARTQLESYVNSGAEQQVQDVALAEHAAKIASLTAEIERLHATAAEELESKLSDQSRRHAAEIEHARSSDSESVRELRKQVADLEAALARAKADAAAGAAHADAQDGEYVERLRAKAEQITTVADHLRRRRARLEKVRRLMRQKQAAQPSAGAQGSAQMRADQQAQIERDRQHLLEVRKMLASSEALMVRRWARQRAVVTLACVVFLILFSAATAWTAVNFMFPAVRSASVVLEARARPGQPSLSAEQKESWSDWHREFVLDQAFQQTLTKRLAERRMDQWARVETVGRTLSKDVTIDAEQPGMLVVTLAGTESDSMTGFLDVMANTLITEANRQSTQRPDNALTVGTGERQDAGRVRYASISPVAVNDERLNKALPIFGGIFAAMLAGSLGLYVKMTRSRRVFEEENAVLFQELRPAAT